MLRTMKRRNFLNLMLGSVLASLVQPWSALAAAWNKAAFETTQLNEAQKNLAIENEVASQKIEIIAPDKAENGAIVQIEIKSNIVNTEEISLLVEKNPTPLIAHCKFSNGAQPYLVTRIKMAETSEVKVIVKAGNQYFSNTKNVIVLENGCG